MFPPEPTSSADDWMKGLWSSLQRGGPAFGRDVRCRENEEGFEIVVPLEHPLSAAAKKPLVTFMRQYSKACGWPLKSVRITNHYMALVASRAASSKAKNL